MKRENLGDGWYESEEPTRLGLVTELQRIRRRFVVRPIPVLLLAALITAGVVYRIANKARIYEADVVLALDEGSMVSSKSSIPFDELKEYVSSVLMPDAKLLALIEKRDLHRLRRTMGPQYALGELRDQLEIEIWKNSFIYYHAEDTNAQKSARIGLTVLDEDPDQAFEIAHDLASIIIQTHEEQRQRVSGALAREVKLMRQTMTARLLDVTTAITVKQTAVERARRDRKLGLVAAYQVDLGALAQEAKHLETELATITASPEAVADRVTRAGLDTTLKVVEERRPERQEQSGFVLAMVLVVVGTGALLGAALFLGAFDSRVHDTDDVTRLGLPVLGHVPGFPGDQVGSLRARGARRARVPSFLRWRSIR
ncbi:MAG: hypothetical protein H0T89_09895 [Deltaproteobacteria bacterium]|nr:hypothetical protein [Deltaproteobacteria bacterium]MDQ3298123.1 hypothetical protein [Myxococcota bacterium]